MKVNHIPFQKTGFFSKMMSDYLEKKESIIPFYNNFSDSIGFKNQITKKETNFLNENRKVLVQALKKQYHKVTVSEKTTENIDSLLQKNTFTITTGHQLNLFTGPLYFFYKIISTINLCEVLKEKFPEKNFVPIYWMATEDHDFEEINFFNFKDKKIEWNREDGGAVGRFSTDGLQSVYEEFSQVLGTTKNATYLKELFFNGYVKHENLTEATRFIVNELFATYGLVILDGDDVVLKKQFVPFIKDELTEQISFTAVSKTISKLEKNYAIQVNPREINLFYLTDKTRERIILENGIYSVKNTDITFSKASILEEVEQHPGRFSPNVIMRPLYQEVVLPNLCYIGGGGELAYWFQLKNYFEKVNIPFPILLLRNSVQLLSNKQDRKLKNLDISLPELFLKQHELLSKKVQENSDITISFADKKHFLQHQFNELREVAKKTDVTFVNAVNAQEKKQLNGLDALEKRLLKAEKRRQEDLVTRITTIQNELLPNQSLEERQRNFSEFYLAYGPTFLTSMKESLHPLQLEFTVITLD